MRIFADIRARKQRDRAAQLPHPDFPSHIKRIILDALRVAWNRVCASIYAQGGVPLSCIEDELTRLLQMELEELRSEPITQLQGFTGSLFESVSRGRSEESFDGSSLKKQPDLAFRLIQLEPGRDESDKALFVECKIVDRAYPVSLYGSQGILRFVKGEYAWQMPCSMMVAYAGQGYTVPETLTPHLREHSDSASDRYLTESLPTEDSSFYTGTEPRVYISRHKRIWEYEGGGSPGAIDILHVWLPAE